MEEIKPIIFNIDDELVALSSINYTLNIDINELEFENKMFKLQNNILRDDIKRLENDLLVEKFKINSLLKNNKELFKKNKILNLVIEDVINKYNKLLNNTYKNK